MSFAEPHIIPLDKRFFGKNNRREIFRIGVSRPVVLSDDTGTAFAGETLDISSKGFGALFECPFTPPEEGAVYTFVVCIDFSSIVEGIATIVRFNRSEDPEGYETGFEILEMSEKSREILSSFIFDCQTRLARLSAEERRNKGKIPQLEPCCKSSERLSLRLDSLYSALDSKLVPYAGEKGA